MGFPLYNHTKNKATIEFFQSLEYNDTNCRKRSALIMNSYVSCDKTILERLYAQELSKLEACKKKGLKLDMSRGKPSIPPLFHAAATSLEVSTLKNTT